MKKNMGINKIWRGLFIILALCMMMALSACKEKFDLTKAKSISKQLIEKAYTAKNLEELQKNIEDIKKMVSDEVYQSRFDLENPEVFGSYYEELNDSTVNVIIIDIATERTSSGAKSVATYIINIKYDTGIETYIASAIIRMDENYMITEFKEYFN